ncbi:MAG: S9 family peptidase [Ignavibacteriales bacterium]|nr:MAG: S9 family peptidase [Ignavibacteriaceae bacterium]MBV6445231.1 Dipeptidyl aminopeptidase 4 [Ignavibacteriaceae bacterium]MBZ0195887.1 S9 family peptidase [Ignavibacteriaceae bacterium]MCZ2142347.1 S9 family peptidase [Ignavibacteriales bacterium]WKZ73510.1 MAG: DPP IV N-terminal domain-containing protein [Ignavibacteriaceae bacterium]
MKLHFKVFLFFVLITFVVVPQKKITLDKVFSGEFSGQYFRPVKWTESGHTYYKIEDDVDGSVIYKIDVKSGEKEELVKINDLVPEGKKSPLNLSEYKFSPSGTWMLIYTNTKRVWRVNSKGDYWIYNIKSKKLRKLGGDEAAPSTLQFAKIDPTEKFVAYVRENNLYLENLENGDIKPLTKDGSRTIINGTFDWVYEEEFGIRDGFRWSPDGKMIAFWQLDAEGVKDFLMIDNTDSLYSYTIPVQYPKAGETNSACKVGTVDISTGEIVWMNVGDDTRNNYIPRMEWAGESGKLAFQHLNRLQNEMTVYLADPHAGKPVKLYSEKRNEWIDVVNDWMFLKNNRDLFWVSEKEGYRQLYTIDINTGEMKNIINQPFDVIQVAKIDEDNSVVYFYASPENATQKYLYEARLDGSAEPIRITPEKFDGTNSYSISADGLFAYHTVTSINSPPKVALIELPSHNLVKQETTNQQLQEKLWGYGYLYELFTIKTTGGVDVDGWMVKPSGFDPDKKYPVLFYVYNEPASTTVNDRYDGFMGLFHKAIADMGFVVISVDGRGTPAPKGTEWRKSIYQKIGVISSEDQAKALVALLKEYPFLDDTKVGIWGWSGGGSMTLNMLFRYPELYKFGISVAPVTDLRFYDSIYEERYMGLPQQHAEAYKECSPVTYAGNLKGRLFLIHGTGDDNVHFQNSEVLVNKLVAAGKQFRFMAYPNRSHGISEGEGTSLHLFNSIINFLQEELDRK